MDPNTNVRQKAETSPWAIYAKILETSKSKSGIQGVKTTSES